MTMTAIHHFVPNGILVSEAVLGSERFVAFQGHDCKLIFPSQTYDFGVDPTSDLEGYTALQGQASRDGKILYAQVFLIRIEVEMDGDLKIAQFPQGEAFPKALTDEGFRLLRESADIASNLLTAITAQARIVKGQFWLDPQHNLPRVIWRSELRDDSGVLLPLGYGGGVSSRVHSDDDQIIGDSDIETLLSRVSNQIELPVPETLLADAMFYAWRSRQPDPRLGLTLAAFACEAKIKTYLQDVATAEQLKLVELVINSPRDVSVQAAGLFDKALEAVIGVSLRTQKPDLYKRINLVFEHRNAFAHKSHTGVVGLDAQEIRKDILAVKEVFDWLASFE